MNMEAKIAHLGFIQGVINRMGANSFLLKGWSVTLVAAIFALSAKDSDHKFVLIAYFPVFVFWILDAFFLHQEKLYRKLYEEVAADRIKSDNFMMDTSCVRKNVENYACIFFSKTLLPFHGAVVGIILFTMFILM